MTDQRALKRKAFHAEPPGHPDSTAGTRVDPAKSESPTAGLAGRLRALTAAPAAALTTKPTTRLSPPAALPRQTPARQSATPRTTAPP